MRIVSISLLGVTLALAGCIDWPDVPEPERGDNTNRNPTLTFRFDGWRKLRNEERQSLASF